MEAWDYYMLNTAFITQRYLKWLSRHYRLVLIAGTLFAIAGFFYSVKLYKNLKTDIEELLPENVQSVIDLRGVLGRVGGLNHISIIIESSHVSQARQLTQDITRKLHALPVTLVARVEDNIKSERQFFEKNKALYIDLKDWEDIEYYVRNRLHYERKKGKSLEKPNYDFDALRKKYKDRAGEFDRFPKDYFESQDGKIHVILAFLPGKVTDIVTNRKLSDAAHEIVRALNPKSYAPDIEVGFDGDVQTVVEEQQGLVADLIKSSIVVTVLVGLALLLFFRTTIGVVALSTSLAMGTAWTFGLSYWLVGYLNANTAFLGSIVVGNGINFGIIFLARYLEEKRKGHIHKPWSKHLTRAFAYTVQATWTAAVAAGFSYASLIFTDFRGFNQFGIIGGLGMFFCWISSFTVLPALLIWLEKHSWLKLRPGPMKITPAKTFSRFVRKAYTPIFVFTVVSIFVSIVFVFRLSQNSIETDFTKLRNKAALEHGSGFWAKKVDQVFGRYLTPTLILVQKQSETEKLISTLKTIQQEEGNLSPIADVKRVEDFLPQDTYRKIKIISHLQELLVPKALAQLKPSDRKIVDEFFPKHKLNPIQPKDLPEALLTPFRELDGTIGRIVHVYPRLQTANFWDANEVIRFTERLRDAIRRAGLTAPIAGQPPISADMISAVSTEGPKAAAFAFLSVVFLVLIIFPHWTLFRSVLGALILGILWMGGVMGAFHLKINFLNFIALPITFGIGVDYAVNIFSRYQSDKEGSIERVIENTGGAVALCSATTIIGYSSLLLAGSQAFFSFGLLAVLGEITCLTAAVVALPAIWNFFRE